MTIAIIVNHDVMISIAENAFKISPRYGVHCFSAFMFYTSRWRPYHKDALVAEEPGLVLHVGVGMFTLFYTS